MKLSPEVYIRLAEDELAFISTVRYFGIGIPVRFPIAVKAEPLPIAETESEDLVRIPRKSNGGFHKT